MIYRVLGYIGVVLVIYTAGVGSGTWITANKYKVEVAQCKADAKTKEAEWATKVANSQKDRGDALQKLLDSQHEKEEAVKRIGEANAQRINDLRRDNAGLSLRVRNLLKKAAAAAASKPAGGLPSTTASLPRPDGTSESDQLWQGIGESLNTEVVEPADKQTSNLIGLQDYVTDVCRKKATVR